MRCGLQPWLKWAIVHWNWVWGPQKIIILHSWAPNFKFGKFLPEPWSLVAGTLPQGLEFWNSVGDQSLLVSLLTCIMITDVFWTSFAYFFLPNITTFLFAFTECCNYLSSGASSLITGPQSSCGSQTTYSELEILLLTYLQFLLGFQF